MKNINLKIIRDPKKSNYTIMKNFHLHDKKLSLKAKGLMSWLLSLRNETWDFSLEMIAKICKDRKNLLNSH